jgi:hypothetical protein
VSDYGEYTDYDEPPPGNGEGAGATRLGPTAFGLIGAAIGLVLGFALAWAVGGNPFSDTNEVVYRDVIVGSITEAADQLCWAQDPDRRDSQQECAILALDPALEVPQPGQAVTIGIVEVATPDGDEFTQVVHVAPTDPAAVDDPEGEEPADGDAPAEPGDAGAEPAPEDGAGG